MNETEVAALFRAWQSIIKLLPIGVTETSSFTKNDNNTVTICVGDNITTVDSLEIGIITLHQLVLGWIIAFTEAASDLACLRSIGEGHED